MSNPYRCSFCGKYDDEVWKLIAGVNAFICDGCVDMCTDIVRKGRAEQPDHNKEETMSDNADLYKEIHALQVKMTRLNDGQERLSERIDVLTEIARTTNTLLSTVAGLLTDFGRRITDLEKK